MPVPTDSTTNKLHQPLICQKSEHIPSKVARLILCILKAYCPKNRTQPSVYAHPYHTTVFTLV